METRPDLVEIKDFWEKSARAPLDSDGLRPTARDPYLQQVVEAIIERRLSPSARVYDIGCGDGLSTIRFAKSVLSIVGLDYVETFVATARGLADAEDVANARFEQADVLDLSSVVARHERADISITIRCLINLPTWEHQKVAITEIAQTLKPGGLYLLSEGWKEGLEGLSRARLQAGLTEMGAAVYNTFISRTQFEAFVARDFEIVEYQSLGFYLFASRVLQPAVMHPTPPNHLHDINRVAAELLARGIGAGAFEDLDYAGVYVLRRR